MKKCALILAGGADLKFWPRSLQSLPKQFVCLFDNMTLFQKTFQIVSNNFDKEDIWVVVNSDYKDIVKEQIPEIEDKHIICEPMSRHTAAAIGLAQAILMDKYPVDTVMTIFPSDHYIQNQGEFNIAIENAVQAAWELKGIITIGVQPTRPEVQFGYIQYDEEQKDLDSKFFELGLRRSINFAEKPDLGTAQRFIESGDFVWNSGILAVRNDVLNKSFEEFLNYHYEQFSSLRKYIKEDKSIFDEELLKLYKTLNKISIDYGILENASNVYVLEGTFGWTDLNDWDEVFRIVHKDARDNAVLGNIVLLDTKNSMVISDEKPVAVIGMEDIILINTEKAILLCKQGEANKVGNLVEYLKKNNISIY